MGPEQLFAMARDVTRDLPEAHWLTRRFRHARFKSAVDGFVDAVYSIDAAHLDDEDYMLVERATQIVTNAVEIHMLLNCDAAECQILGQTAHRLHDALIGLEQGLAIDPSLRPAKAALLDSLSAEIEELGIVQSLSPQIPLLRR